MVNIMRVIIVLALCLIISPFAADRVEAFAVQPQQMKPTLDNAFKKQQEEMVELSRRQAAKETAEKRAKEEEEKTSQQLRTAVYWVAGLFAGFVVFRKLRS